MSTHTIHVITLAEAEPAHIESVREILQSMAELHRQEEGCLRFDVYADAAKPHRFNTIEVWESLDAHKRHLNAPLVTRSVLMLIGKMRGLPDIRILNTVSEMPD